MFALGLMSKPMLVTLPFILFLLDFWPLGRLRLAHANAQRSNAVAVTTHRKEADILLQHPSLAARRLVLEKLPFFALAAASCLITLVAQHRGGAVASFAMLSLDARLATAVVAYVHYLAKLFWPVNLSPICLHPDHWGPWVVTGAVAVLVVLTAATWRGRSRFPYALMGWLWFLGMLVPVIGIVQVGSQAFADRYTYLPAVGIMIAVVWLGTEAFDYLAKVRQGAGHDRPPEVSAPSSLGAKGMLPALLALAILGTLAWRTREQIGVWRDTGSLFGHALALDPANVQALYGVGVHLVNTGHLDEGKRFLEQAIHLHPDYPEALGALASMFDGQGKYADAIRFYEAGLKAQPDQDTILNNLAWLLASCPDAALRNGPEAVRLATRACELTDYTKPLVIGTLAAAQAEAGDFSAAIATAERAAALAARLHLDEVTARNRELIQLYRQGQAYHEKREGG